MKTLTALKEQLEKKVDISHKNPGNGGNLSNMYTPLDNIVTNVRNYFAHTFGFTVERGPQTSIVVRCHRWTSREIAEAEIFTSEVCGINLIQYITQQGLNQFELVLDYGLVSLIAFTTEVKDGTKDAVKDLIPAPDNMQEHEIEWYRNSEIKEGFDEEELHDDTPEKIRAALTAQNKVKGAEEFADIVGSSISLPPDYYFKAVRDNEGNESIALRYKYERRRPFGKKAEYSTSIMNIYGGGPEAVWIGGFEDMDSMPEDQKTLIDNILELIGAKKTSDPCVYSLEDDEDNENEDDNKDDDSKEEDPKDQEENGDNKEEEDKNNKDEDKK